MKFNDYKPELIGVAIAAAVLNLWYLSSIAVEKSILPAYYDYFAKFITVAIGGFIGAYSAFYLRKLEENKKEYREYKNQVSHSLFILARMMNAVSNIKRDFDQYVLPFERGFCLPANKQPDYEDIDLGIKNLTFLIDRDMPNILMDLSLEQDRFSQAMSAIEIRNEFYVNELQPALSEHSLNGKSLTLDEYRELLGERIFEGAMNGAQTMYGLVEASDKSLEKTFKQLRGIAKEMFPKEKFINWNKT